MIYNSKELLKSLDLDKVKYVWVQKVLGIPLQIYIFTYDSRWPTKYLSIKRVKDTRSAVLKRSKTYGKEFIMDDYRLTPPLLVEQATIRIPTGTTIIKRDIAGDYFGKSLSESMEIIEWKN